ncbi:MAG: glycosyltransferase [Gammaproteobacteria bacterium]
MSRRLDGHTIEESACSRVRLYTFLTLFGIGGTEKQVVALSRHLDPARFDQKFGCLRRWGPLLEDMEREYGPIPEYRIPNLYSPQTLRQQLRLAATLHRQRVEILHSYNFYANVFSLPAAKLARVPCVVASIRDMGVYLTPKQQYVHKWVCRLADRIVVNTDAIKNRLISLGYRGERITLIPNGVDLAGYNGLPADSSLRRRLGLPENAQLVLMLARLNPQKGCEYFLRAAARVSPSFPRAYFLIVGGAFTGNQGGFAPDHDYPRRLADLAASLGIGERLRITGFITEIPQLLAQVSVSVLPSLSEGLSNTLLESMAAGVPVVATRVGGTPEAITDGELGLLVPPKDDAALAGAIGAILANPELARRLGSQARARVVQRYSMQRMVQANQDLYMSLLAKRAQTRRKAAVH